MNHTFGTYPFNISSKIKHFYTCLLLFFVFLFITLALTLAGLNFNPLFYVAQA